MKKNDKICVILSKAKDLIFKLRFFVPLLLRFCFATRSKTAGVLRMTILLGALGSWFLVLGSFFSGCIRLTGKAGYWHKGPDDEYAKSKQVGFDTQKFVPGYTPGRITTGEE